MANKIIPPNNTQEKVSAETVAVPFVVPPPPTRHEFVEHLALELYTWLGTSEALNLPRRKEVVGQVREAMQNAQREVETK